MILEAVKADLAVFAGGATPVPPPAPAAEGQTPAVPVSPRAPLVETNYPQTGYNLDVMVRPDTVLAAANVMDRHGFALETITGVDWLAEGQMEVVYDFNHYKELCRVVLRLRVDRAAPEVPTISAVYAGAEWHERETHDFFGIRFSGLANLGPFLLPEDATFHPLRKDYTP